uniref:Phorbol-ester/DAG-type domain-containing protein n=1 Tax=Macrostomum lignano TaxID=282301 RepID=A0A1I8IXA9_9PLAT
KSGGENGNSSSFWSFFKPNQEAAAAAKPSAALAEAEEVTLVPKAAKVHGGDPVLILLPDGGRSVSADCRYCLVYEGTNRRHLASCELAPDRRALFSRVPEHDAPETVRLSLHRLAPTPSSSAQPLLSNLEFSFVPDPMTAVAAAIAAAFPSVPSELAELSACASASAAADCDRQLSDALSRLGDENFNRVENFAGLQSSATALYWLAERGWLDSFADLATRRRDGQSMLDTWLSAGEDGGKRLRQALLSDSRCPRAALGSPDRLRLWLRAVASACSRRRRRRRPPGPEDAVVRVASWVTPTAAPLVVMTTNLAKSSTASLEQDLALFPGLEASHAREHFHRYGSDSDYDEDAPRETACVQTETGKSMEDLQQPQKRPFDEVKEAASNPETLLHGSRSPACNNYPSSPLTSPSPLPSPSPSPAPAVCVDTVDSATSKSVKSATSALALSASARSISTPSLFGDLNSEQQQGRKKRRSFLSRLGSSYRMKHKQQQHQQQHLAVPQTPGDHDWVLVSSGRCAVCEAEDGAGCRLRCRVCQLTVHSADQCRGRVVACLPAIAETPQQGASAAAPAAATAAVKPEVALAVELFKKKKSNHGARNRLYIKAGATENHRRWPAGRAGGRQEAQMAGREAQVADAEAGRKRTWPPQKPAGSARGRRKSRQEAQVAAAEAGRKRRWPPQKPLSHSPRKLDPTSKQINPYSTSVTTYIQYESELGTLANPKSRETDAAFQDLEQPAGPAQTEQRDELVTELSDETIKTLPRPVTAACSLTLYRSDISADEEQRLQQDH